MTDTENNTKSLSTNEMYGIKETEFKEFLEKQGYIEVKQLSADKEWVAMLRLGFSVSVCCGIDTVTPFKYRWCFANQEAATEFYENMKEFDDIPKNQNMLVGHRQNGFKPLLILQDERGNNKG
ncbi:MAG: hypothetical protein J6N72_03650 [Psychrobacter sp.]|nr:hypothetical protein [Psychrobacter sp.]